MKRRSDFSRVRRALDQARFGRDRMLDLHEPITTAEAAADRAERWVREHQVRSSGDLLIITGRGAHSADGVSVVRAAVQRRLQSLRRGGVIASLAEHTAGAFVVQIAPMRDLLDAPKRRRGPTQSSRRDPPGLAALPSGIRDSLRELAILSLCGLGMNDPAPRFVEEEMLHQFSRLSATLGAGGEAALRSAIQHALREYRES